MGGEPGRQVGRQEGRRGIIVTPRLIGQLWPLDGEGIKKKKRTQPSLEVFFFLREFLANGFGFEMSEVKKRGVEWSGVK